MDSIKGMARALDALGGGRLDDADSILLEILQIDAHDVKALFAHGMVSAARGDLNLALERLHSTLAIDPNFLPAIERLAVFSLQLGLIADATRWSEAGLALEPGNIECLMVSGQCANKRGSLGFALDRFQQAATVRPGDASVQSDLADVLTSLGRLPEALERFRAALDIDPTSYRARVMMAQTLTELGRTEESKAHWSRAESSESSPGQTALAQALTLGLSGEFSEAEKAAKRAIELNPARGKAYSTLLSLRPVREADIPILDAMEVMLDYSNVSIPDRVDLLYGLGKAYDDLGEYERAIQKFDEANLLLRRLRFGNRPFDRVGFRNSIDAQIERFDATTLSKSGLAEEQESPVPIFVVGMIRSGTTLVDQILSSHAQVGSAGELAFWLVRESLAGQLDRDWQSNPGVQSMRAEYLSLLQLIAPDRARVIDKNPANVLVAGALSLLYPGSRIVCTQRHAVDVALSIWTTQMRTEAPFVGDRADIVFAYEHFLRLVAHWQNAMPKDRFSLVKYEDMVGDPGGVARKLVAHCGLEWDEACLRPQENTRTIRTPSFWQAKQPVYRTSVDRWKHYEKWLGPFSELIGI